MHIRQEPQETVRKSMTTSGLAANGFLKQNDFLRESKLSIIAQVFRKARFPRRARRRRAAPGAVKPVLLCRPRAGSSGARCGPPPPNGGPLF